MKLHAISKEYERKLIWPCSVQTCKIKLDCNPISSFGERTRGETDKMTPLSYNFLQRPHEFTTTNIQCFTFHCIAQQKRDCKEWTTPGSKRERL